MCFWCSIDYSFENPKHVFRLRKKNKDKINFKYALFSGGLICFHAYLVCCTEIYIYFFNLMLHLFYKDSKQPRGYYVVSLHITIQLNNMTKMTLTHNRVINGGIHLTSGFDDICGVCLVCTLLPPCEYRQGHIDFKYMKCNKPSHV